jgi:hypothetical protein
MDEFTQSYFQCSLWTSEDESGERMDALCTIADFSAATREQMEFDSRRFQEENAELLTSARRRVLWMAKERTTVSSTLRLRETGKISGRHAITAILCFGVANTLPTLKQQANFW